MCIPNPSSGYRLVSNVSTRPAPAALPRLLGGELVVDFVNTVDPRFAENRIEYLQGYVDLVAWAEYAAGLPADVAQRLRRKARRDPAIAAAATDAAITLRESVHGLLSSALMHDKPRRADLATLNSWIGQTLNLRGLAPDADGALSWRWAEVPDRLDRPLWPVVLSAAELLTSERLRRLRRCAGDDGCGWLFLDQSKTGRRQWCSMQGCGNRAKARRHYARVQGKSRP